jgi:protein-disulfide isomerase
MSKDPFEAIRAKLRTENQPSFGSSAAPIVIVVFSDFECPFCKMESTVLRSNLIQAYPSLVRVVFKDFPNARMHPWANQASILGRCIFDQNPSLFWEYHDWIFEHQSEISPDNLQGKVQDALRHTDLHQGDLDSCRTTREPQEAINRSLDEGANVGVTGTPILFINGRMMLGAAWPSLQQAVETELGHQKKTKVALPDCGCGVPDTSRAAVLLRENP